MKRRWGRYGLVAGALFLPPYFTFLGVLYHKMSQPPEVFGAFMRHVPLPVVFLVPFETMWNRARGGALAVGDPAPDFELSTPEGGDPVRLSAFRGQKPVVLIFGSLT